MNTTAHPHHLFAFLSCLKVTHETIATRVGVSIHLVDSWNNARKPIALARSVQLFALALEATEGMTRFPDRAKAEALLAYLRAQQEQDAARLAALQAIPTAVDVLADLLRIHPIATWGEPQLTLATSLTHQVAKELREAKRLKLLPHPHRTKALAQLVQVMEYTLARDVGHEGHDTTQQPRTA